MKVLSVALLILILTLVGVRPALAQGTDTPVTFTLSCVSDCTATYPGSPPFLASTSAPIMFTVNNSAGYDVVLSVSETFHYHNLSDGNGCYFNSLPWETDNAHSNGGPGASSVALQQRGSRSSCTAPNTNSGTITSEYVIHYAQGSFELDSIGSAWSNAGPDPMDVTFSAATVTVPNGTSSSSTATPGVSATPTTPGEPTATLTATATFNLYVYATVASSGQPIAVVYTVTAGEATQIVLDVMILALLTFLVFLAVVRGRS